MAHRRISEVMTRSTKALNHLHIRDFADLKRDLVRSGEGRRKAVLDIVNGKLFRG